MEDKAELETRLQDKSRQPSEIGLFKLMDKLVAGPPWNIYKDPQEFKVTKNIFKKKKKKRIFFSLSDNHSLKSWANY